MSAVCKALAQDILGIWENLLMNPKDISSEEVEMELKAFPQGEESVVVYGQVNHFLCTLYFAHMNTQARPHSQSTQGKKPLQNFLITFQK